MGMVNFFLNTYIRKVLRRNTYIRKVLRRSIFRCSDTSKLGEKRIPLGVGTKCQPVDGFSALQNSVPNYPWADFYHRIRIFPQKQDMSSKRSNAVFVEKIRIRW